MRFYDRKGSLLSSRDWLDLLQDPDYRNLKQSRVPTASGLIVVQTVWHGTDWTDDGTPDIFETTARFAREPSFDIIRTAHAETALSWHSIIRQEHMCKWQTFVKKTKAGRTDVRVSKVHEV